jgi:maltooligosyltrehalose trehalohydrolase
VTFDYRFGPKIESGGVRFRLWAPSAGAVDLEMEGSKPVRMTPRDKGWHEVFVACGAGTRYRFRIGDTAVPDPASRQQDGGVHGWSVVRTPVEANAWQGRPWTETVLYELHPGLEGGFAGIAQKLEGLADLGVTAIELMPVAAFPGKRNWGYDGVLPFAPAEAYGATDELRRMIAKAHALNLSVFLDVVYNHFGPDGNYLGLYAKPFFRNDMHTPWGAGIDFRQDEVRAFFFENATYWVHEFGFDGLRFDAVHAIREDGWLETLARALKQGVGPDRQLHLTMENAENQSRYLRNGFDAQWNDDMHHALHVLLTGETKGYYQDFADKPAVKLARALAEGFVFQGEPSVVHDGGPRGTPSKDLKPKSFVSFLQNHDQIGNRAFGDRLTVLARPEALKAAIALLLLSPQIPMLFMGEEIGSKAPFLYFTDVPPDLAEAVRKGRKREFAAFLDDAHLKTLPDPNAPETYAESDPARDAPDAVAWRDLYRSLLTIRREKIMPGLNGAFALDANALNAKAVIARWQLDGEKVLTIACNLGEEPVKAGLPDSDPIWGKRSRDTLAGETTLAWLESS